MGKLLSFLDVFREGSTVANPELWKHGGAALQTALAAFIMSVVGLTKGFGIELPIDAGKATAIAGGIVAIVGVVVTYVSSDKVGLLPAKPSDVAGTPGNEPAPQDARSAEAVGGGPTKPSAADPVRRVDPSDHQAIDYGGP